MMDPVDEIDIGPAAAAEHHFRPRRPPSGPRMARAVHDPVIRLYLDDPSRGALPSELCHQHLAQQVTRYGYHRCPLIECRPQFCEFALLTIGHLSVRLNLMSLNRTPSGLDPS